MPQIAMGSALGGGDEGTELPGEPGDLEPVSGVNIIGAILEAVLLFDKIGLFCSFPSTSSGLIY